jgi:selenocysteine-specific elongation factor
MPVIMGTAGHIDHGKTSLVRALTGIDCDRLEEEKRRGITIELGFAYLDLPGIDRLGIVDVPGHERFVKNMVAGAAGIDFVMLVIAADEGVMPQTREHLEICSLLGTDTGLVALTKVDMVDEEMLELVQEDISEFLQGTFLEGAPVMPVSSHTGQGMDALKAKLVEIAASFKPRRRTDLFRLPIDRIFSMKGYGTVITGTLIAGAVGVGQDILVYPQQKSTKVRTIQVHGRADE